MTLLLFLKPHQHAGPSLDLLPKRKRKRAAKKQEAARQQVTEQVTNTMGLALAQAEELVNRILEEEQAFKEQQIAAAIAAEQVKLEQERLAREAMEESLRQALLAQIRKQQEEAIRQQQEAQRRAAEFLAHLQALVRKKIIERRRKLTELIAAAIDWF